MKIYPEKITPVEPDAIDKASVASVIINLRELGAPSGYVGFKERAELSKEHITSIALAGKNCSAEVAKVYDDIEAERQAFEAVSVQDATTQTDYLNKLNAVKTYLNSSTWLTKLKEKYGVTTWADLKNATKAVVGEIEP